MQATGRSVLLALLFGAAVYFFTLTRQFDFPRVPGRLGPDIWPQTLLVLLMITCAIGIGHDVLGRRRHEPSARSQDELPTPPSDGASEPSSGAFGYGLVAGGFLLLLGYPIALEYLGFLLATFLFMTL